MVNDPPFEVYLLGLVDFEEAQLLQQRLIFDLGEEGLGGALILCEHPPTISVGRSGSRAHIRADDEELHERGIRVRWINRGGGCVLHLPGQINAYLMLPLAPDRMNLRLYLDKMHAAVIGTLADFGLSGSTRPDCFGVFLGSSRVASVGVAVKRWIAYHGLTLNVGPYLEPFRVLQEPGPGSGPVPDVLRQTSMEAHRQRPVPMAKVRESLIRHIEAAFGLESHHLYTDHPLIRKKARPHVYAQSLG
ncbi:lipoyl(octanoyl) transferase LipB [soil metagenome]